MNEAPLPPPPGWAAAADADPRGGAAQGPPALGRESPTPLRRFLGGSPANVAGRLFLVSLIVGALFMWLGVSPADLWRGVNDLFVRISRLGFDAVREVINYVLVGAAVVIPIWFVLRLLDMRNDR